MQFHPIAFGGVERFDAGGEEQIVGGTGAGDVEQAFALFEFFAAFAGGEERHAGGDFFLRVVFRDAHERAEFVVERGVGAIEARLAVEIGDDDERELEALCAVDRHQANDVGRFGAGGGQRFLGRWAMNSVSCVMNSLRSLLLRSAVRACSMSF